MIAPLPYLTETPSQTAGPYVHIGLIPHQAGFDIFEKNFSNVLVGPETHGRAHPHRRAVSSTALGATDDATSWSRSGRPTRLAATTIPPTGRTTSRSTTGSAAGAGPGPISRPAFSPSRRSSRARSSGARPGASRWRRTSTSGSSARGINIGLATRMYFADETAANAEDPVLNMIEPAVRRETLIARREDRDGEIVYVFDIRLQGERETVFFDI